MDNVSKINRYLLQQIKEKNFDKDIALDILKRINSQKDGEYEDIAIIGIGGRFPGADNVEQFWNNLLCSKNSVKDIPNERERILKESLGIDGEIHLGKGGYLDRVDLFDESYFGISPAQANEMSMEQRGLLEVTAETIENSGIGFDRIRGTKTGVFIGKDHYVEAKRKQDNDSNDFLSVVGFYPSILSGRVSYSFNLKGPNMVIDTACSSALIAIHYACMSLKNGECNMALAGGVNLFPYGIVKGPNKDLEADDGVIKVFDKQAHGVAFGEGISTVLLKPLKQAEQDGNYIYGVIKGSATNCSGLSNGITAPNPEAQKNVVLSAWKDAGVKPEDISYIETQGTGTVIGDALELKAIAGAFGNKAQIHQCGIGTVKPNIGHLVATSGMASLMKMILSLKYNKIPSMINFSKMNSSFDIENSPLYINTKVLEWEPCKEKPRVCGINSFGFSGSNCHIVLAEYKDTRKTEKINRNNYIFKISAWNKDILLEYAKRYLDFMNQNKEIDLAKFCYVADVARRDFSMRFVAVVTSVEELREILLDLVENRIEGNKHYNESVFMGEGKAGIYISYEPGKEKELCKQYVTGTEIDWKSVFHSNIILAPIPSYPFCRNSYFKKTKQILKEEKEKVTLIGRESNVYTDIERKTADIFGTVFGYDTIDIQTSFIEMGGESILAMRIVSEINDIFGLSINADVIFRYLMFEELCIYIEKLQSKVIKKKDTIEIRNYEKLPLLPSQRRIAYEELSQDCRTKYNLSQIFKIDGHLEKDKVEYCMSCLLKRHEGLRINVVSENGEMYQKVKEYKEFHVNVMEASDENALAILSNCIAPFDIEKDLLIRVIIVRSSSDYLIFDMHHLIVDGTSIRILLTEFVDLYGEKEICRETVDYTDFVLSVDQRRNSEQYSKKLTGWKEYLSGYSQGAGIPTDYKRTAYIDNSGDVVHYSLDLDRVNKIHELVQTMNVTPFVFYLSAFFIITQKFSCEDDMVIAIPTACRNSKEAMNMVSFLANTLPIRSKLNETTAYKEYIAEMGKQFVRLLSYEECSFDDIVSQQNVKRVPGRNPLFDFMFVMQNEQKKEYLFNGQPLESMEIDYKVAKYDISLIVYEKKEQTSLCMEYKKGLYSEETIKSMLKAYLCLIDDILCEPEKKIEDAKLIDENDISFIQSFHTQDSNSPKYDSVLQAFWDKKNKLSSEAAILTMDKTFTYQQIEHMSNHLAKDLVSYGVTSNTIVALCLQPSAECVVSMLGIFKARGAYLPIDENLPKERIEYIFKDSKTKYIITSNKVEKKFDFQGKYFFVEQYVEDTNDYHYDYSIECVKDETAYAIYTSGSTGKPKGVLVNQGSLTNLLNQMEEVIPIGKEDIMLFKTNYSFDVSITELFSWFFGEGKVFILPEEMRKDPNEIIQSIYNNKITYVNFTPSMFQVFLEATAGQRKKLSSLKYVILAGEELHAMQVRRCSENLPNVDLYNMYGPTEATVYTTFTKITLQDEGRITIGKPFPSMKAYILDKNQNMVPFHCPGELCIAGDGVAAGYLNNKELTEKKFITDIFDPDKKMYLSGDKARWTKEGNIEYLGRIDRQIKLRGYRIEMDEIENCLLGINGIIQAAVILKSVSEQTQYLVAFYEQKDGCTSQYIIEKLKEKLPYYMVPQKLIEVDEIPVNINGKKDYYKLYEYEVTFDTQKQYTLKSKVEIQLAQIWREILETDNIDFNQDFFELGGDSLKVMRLMAELNQAFHIKMSMDLLFRKLNFFEQVECIENAHKTPLQTVEKIDQTEKYPLSNNQLSIYLASQISDNKLDFNMPLLVDIEGNFDIQRANMAFQELILRHESLRTSFEVEDGMVYQKVNESVPFSLEYQKADESDLELLKEQFVRPFDLGKAPLIRGKILEFSNKKYALLVDMHHVISDGYSMQITYRDFISLYSKKQLPQLAYQFKEYVYQMLNSRTNRTRDKQFWLDQFNEPVEVLDFPDITNSCPTGQGDWIHYRLGIKKDQIEQMARNLHVTVFTVLMSVLEVVLAKYSRKGDIVLGTPVSGRIGKDMNEIIGPFINILPLRVQVEKDFTYQELVSQVNSCMISAYEHQEYPYRQIVADVNDKTGSLENELIQTMIIHQKVQSGGLEVDGINFKMQRLKTHSAKYDMSFEFYEDEDGIDLYMEYNTKKCNEALAEQLYDEYMTIMESVLEKNDTKIKELLDRLGQKKAKVEQRFSSIAELFRIQAQKAPDKSAVSFENQEISYRGLNEKSEAFAEFLINNYDKEQTIALYMKRSISMIIAMLGILKTGKAYLPIDTELPKKRIQYMMEDGNVNLVVCSTNTDWMAKENKEMIVMDTLVFDWDRAYVDRKVDPEAVAYIMYTSGTTGLAKGVMVQNKAVHNFMLGMKESLHDTFEGKVLALTTICFDISVLEILLPLMCGGMVVLADEKEQNDMDLLYQFIMNHEIDMVQMTPSRLRMFDLAEKWDVFSRFKKILIGGERFPKELCRQLLLNTSAEIYNMYGPTEGTVWCSVKRVENDEITIGKPIKNMEFFVLDDEYNKMPMNEIGEIYVAGDGLAKGYYHREELTNEKFVDCPYSASLMYKTGDLGCINEHGEIEFHGRYDSQVKVSGHRIELSEIEIKVLSMDKVEQCVVTTVTNQIGMQNIICFYTASGKIEGNSIRDYLKMELPIYMVPSEYFLLEQIPVLNNDKVNYNRLKEIFYEKNSLEDIVNVDKNMQKIKETVLKVWKRILEKEHIDSNLSFQENGGNSLLLVVLHKELKKVFPCKLSISQLYRYNTIALMAEYILSNLPTQVNKEDSNVYNFEKDSVWREKVSTYDIVLNSDELDKLAYVSEQFKISQESVFIALYLYFLSQTKSSSNVTLMVGNKETETKLELNVNMNLISNMVELFEYVEQSIMEKSGVKDDEKSEENERKKNISLYTNETNLSWETIKNYDEIIHSTGEGRNIKLQIIRPVKREDSSEKDRYEKLIKLVLNRLAE